MWQNWVSMKSPIPWCTQNNSVYTKYEIRILRYTAMYQVHCSMRISYRDIPSCPGGQDSRCVIRTDSESAWRAAVTVAQAPSLLSHSGHGRQIRSHLARPEPGCQSRFWPASMWSIRNNQIEQFLPICRIQTGNRNLKDWHPAFWSEWAERCQFDPSTLQFCPAPRQPRSPNMMIGVPTHEIIFRSPPGPPYGFWLKMNIYTNLSEIYIYFKFFSVYILKFQKKITKIINNLYFIICKGRG